MRLKEVSEPTVDHQELLYNASVLAHHARVSTHSAADLTTPATLAEVFDHFVFDTSLRDDSAMMEAAGAQCLLLAGFFEDQLRRRHNIRWYAQPGRRLFQPGRRSGTIPAEGASARRHRCGLRALAPTARPTEPGAARSAVSADPSAAIADIGQAGRGHPGLRRFRVTGAARCTPPATAGSWCPCPSNSGRPIALGQQDKSRTRRQRSRR